MAKGSRRGRVAPPARETPSADVDESAPGGGVLGLLLARFDELKGELERVRAELESSQAETRKTLDEVLRIVKPPTFHANEDVASVVLSHVSDVHTRLALSRVNTVWRNASKHASSLPASLDFTGCPDKLNEKETWKTKEDYVLGFQGVLDLPEARFHDLLEQAGADLSNSKDQCNLGLVYDTAKRYEKGLEWLEKGALQGSAVCEFNMGLLYKFGRGVEKNIDTAIEWFTKAADKGHFYALSSIGTSHYNAGRYKEVFPWFSQAARIARAASPDSRRSFEATSWQSTTSDYATNMEEA
jgi:tetratricopeptide (TPR) repeat protein